MEQGGGVLQVVSQYDSGTLHGGFARYVRAASITDFRRGSQHQCAYDMAACNG